MTLNSTDYLIFLIATIVIHFLSPSKIRWFILLAASLYLYLDWDPNYFVLLISLTITSQIAAVLINRSDTTNRRNLFLVISIVLNLGTLLFFKYYKNVISLFFEYSIRQIKGSSADFFEVAFPLGLSFFSFRLISYIVDVYKGRQKPEDHFGKFALYASFFPTIVAGPIERASHFLPQINHFNSHKNARLLTGLLLISWGFFKKLVIADRLALIVNTVYIAPTEFSGIPLILATYFYAIQIYCDFSGYTDIAIGTAKILGYDLTENFRQPYFSKSISEFWRRWHITLSNWFRDYVFFPLERKRRRNNSRAQYLNILLVFLLTGMWHGSTVNFLIWGFIQGVFIIIPMIGENLIEKFLPDKHIHKSSWILDGIKITLTFQLISFSWIFFRSNSISDALTIVSKIFSNIHLSSGYGMDIGGIYEIVIISLSLLILLLVDILREQGKTIEFILSLPTPVRWLIYYSLFFSILIFGKLNITEFIYAGF